jgi:hypothetical protein
MLSAQHDPKDLADWMELDYFRRPRRLSRWRTGLVRGSVAVAVVIGVGLAVLPFLPRRSAQALFQSAPVATSHASFGDRCDECHKDGFRTGLRFLAQSDAVASVRDETCSRCHEGPIHQEQQTTTPPCTSCHHEHKGQDALARIADGHCTACHADLQTRERPSRFVRTVTRFDLDHPPFFHWQGGPKDPGTIRFNHRVHLREEGLPPVGERAPGWQPEHLDCRDCHTPDATGERMLPIRYQAHCQRCHPLWVQVAVGNASKEIAEAAGRFKAVPAPHPSQTGLAGGNPFDAALLVRAVLRERYTAFVHEHPQVLGTPEAPSQPRPIPGERSPRSVTKDEAAWVSEQLARAEDQLFKHGGGCRECHGEPNARRADGLPAYAVPSIRERWFAHARFSHHVHREHDCKHCHGSAPASALTSDVLVPEISTCLECHHAGGARTDCVECHRYHGRSGRQIASGIKP